MKETKLYMKPIHQYAYRRDNELPEVVGVVMFQPKETMKKRICYKVEFQSDRFIEYVPMNGVENGNYELVENIY